MNRPLSLSAVPAVTARLLAVIAVLGLTMACDSGTDVLDSGGVSLSTVGTPRELPAGAEAGQEGLILTDGEHTLAITRVAVVLGEVELERVEDDDCPDDVDDDECEEFETGPYLLELGLSGTVEQMVAIQVPTGLYDELEFEIEKPDDDTPDERAFLEDHPEFEDVSIRVEGTFDGEPFLFLQDADEEQELDLDPPLAVEDDGAPTNVTLRMDVSTWFVRGDGTLIDPATANEGGPNESRVEQNIEDSIEAFEDDDRDNDDDHDEDDRDGM